MNNRRILLLCIAGLLLPVLSLFVADPVVQADADDEFVPNEVVVKLVSTTMLPQIAQIYDLDPVPLDQFGARPIYRLRVLDDTSPGAKAEELLDDPQGRVVYAEPNYTAQAPEGRQKASWAIGEASEATYAGQWAPDKIGLPAAQTLSLGRDTVVAILDTGVDVDHPALREKLVPGYDFVGDDDDPREEGIRAPGDPANIAFGHGTHVAGLVALVAPEASIMPLRVLEPDGSGNIWVLAEAVRYAADHGAHVINMSLGTTRRTELIDELLSELACEEEDDDDNDEEEEAEEKDDDEEEEDPVCSNRVRPGVVVVAAAGNGGNTVPEYPAAEDEPELLAVGASTQSDTLASFSTRGSWIDIIAPGEQIISTVPGGYGTWSGTSMAAPLATGAAALVRSYCAMLGARAVVEVIADTATPLSDEIPPRLAVAPALQSACHRTYLPMIRQT
jgi:thermitase